MRRIALVAACVLVVALAGLWAVHASKARKDSELRRQGVAELVLATRKAAEAGDVAAQLALATRLRNGDGVPRDPAAALDWYARAARHGSADAALELGRIHRDGDGVPQDYFRAAEWYDAAIRLGAGAEARFALGNLHLFGRGVAHDFAIGMDLIRDAARRGHAPAQALFAAMIEEGWLGEPDHAEAYKWYTLAIPRRAEVLAYDARRDPVAARDQLGRRMSAFQIRDGERRARAWTPAP